MQRIYDITGKVFGNITAIKPTDQRIRGYTIWECICNCDNINCPKTLFLAAVYLNAGKIKTCRNHRYDRTIHIAIRRYFHKTRTGAKLRDYSFELILEQFHAIIKLPCYYCGNNTDIKRIYEQNKTYRLRANGIDRFDNTLGYTVENSVPCCWQCNNTKNDMPGLEFITLCKRIAEYHAII